MMYPSRKWLRYVLAGIANANLLALWALLRKPRNVRGVLMKTYRAYVYGSGLAPWQVDHLLHIFPEIHGTCEFVVNLGGPYDKDTPLPDTRWMLYISMITKSLAPKMIFEIGTFQGRATLALALNSPPDCQIFTLDLPPENDEQLVGYTKPSVRCIECLREDPGRLGSIFRGHPLEYKITQLLGDSKMFDFSPWYGKVDLILIDGAHAYDFVLSDTKNALKMLRPGGTIIWDDFGHLGDNYDVTRALMANSIKNDVVQIEDTQLCVYRHPGNSI